MDATEDRGARRSAQLRSSVIAIAAARIASAAALIVATPFLARQIGIEAYGVLATLTTTAAILAVADFGIANGIVTRLVSRHHDRDYTQALISSALLVLLGTTGAVVILVGLLGYFLPWPRWLNADSISDSDIRLSVLFALLGAALSITANLGQRLDLARQRGRAVAIWSGAATVSGPSAALAATLLTTWLPAIVAAMALMPVVVLSMETFYAVHSWSDTRRPGLTRATRPQVNECLRSGSIFFLLGLCVAASYQIDGLVVSSALGASAAAEFAVVTRIFLVPSTIFRGSLAQLWPSFAEAIDLQDFAWVRQMLRKSTVLATTLMALICGLLVLIAGPLTREILDSATSPAMLLLVLAAVWMTYTVAVHPLALFLHGAGLQREQLLSAVPMVGVNLLLSVVLARTIGSGGPLLGSLLAHIVCAAIPLGLLSARYLRRHAGITAVKEAD